MALTLQPGPFAKNVYLTTKNLDFSRGFLLEVLITYDKRYR